MRELISRLVEPGKPQQSALANEPVFPKLPKVSSKNANSTQNSAHSTARQVVSWPNFVYGISGALVFVFSEEQTKVEQSLALTLCNSSRTT